jgi:flagellar L-ring protein FlgH
VKILLCLFLSLNLVSLATEIGHDSWFTDQQSFRVGQLLTVLIVEQASGSNNASINTKREDALGMGFSIDGGPLTGTPELAGTSSNKNEHKVKGGNSRSNSLQGQMAAEIVAIDPDGTLILEGMRILEVDGEQQITELSGRVRPEDVSASNTIYSYNIADALIRYSGRGLVSESQRRGLFNWMFGWMF